MIKKICLFSILKNLVQLFKIYLNLNYKRLIDLKKKTFNLVSNRKKSFLPLFYTTKCVKFKTKQKFNDSCHPNLGSN